MKKIIFALLLIVSTSAYAGMWFLEKSDYQPGTGWICTYRLQGTNYYSTVISQNMCQQVISN